MSVNPCFRWAPGAAGDVLVCEPLLAVAPHAFTTRAFGPARTDEQIRDTYARIAGFLNLDLAAIRGARQVHGTAIHIADAGGDDAGVDADIVITDTPGVAVVVRTADCAPVLLADPRTGVVAAVHAGWRGTAADAVGTAVGALAARFGARPEDLIAAIGPAIGSCCYQVGDDVRKAFLTQAGSREPASWFSPDGDRWRLDLWAANRDQLQAAGVAAERVHVAGHCTSSLRDRYYSFRVEGTGAGRQFAAITPRRAARAQETG